MEHKGLILYHVHMSLSMVPILSQMKPVQTLPYYSFYIHFNILSSHLRLSSKWPFLWIHHSHSCNISCSSLPHWFNTWHKQKRPRFNPNFQYSYKNITNKSVSKTVTSHRRHRQKQLLKWRVYRTYSTLSTQCRTWHYCLMRSRCGPPDTASIPSRVLKTFQATVMQPWHLLHLT
jgi:hypothetical protein